MSGVRNPLYNTILFDVDGVLLSEERYFDASALTVYELLFSPRFLGLNPGTLPSHDARPGEAQIRQVRQAVFAQDESLNLMKSKGVNSNWDMVYLQFVTQLLQLIQHSPAASRIVGEFGAAQKWTLPLLRRLGSILRRTEQGADCGTDFRIFISRFQGCANKQNLFAQLESWYADVFPAVTNAEATLRTLWDIGQQAFQEWYLGKEYLPNQPEEKSGFVLNEIPLAAPDEIGQLFSTCNKLGIRIGVATGRPNIETKVPFEIFGWLPYFDSSRITTASDVLETEQAYPEYRPLSKPHPFCYLRSYLGSPESLSILQEYQGPLPRSAADRLLVVGDSVADFMAAQAMGCRFAAVLTGLSGESARSQFEELGADYIWPDIIGMWSLLDEMST